MTVSVLLVALCGRLGHDELLAKATAKGCRAAACHFPRRVRGARVPGPVVLRDPVRSGGPARSRRAHPARLRPDQVTAARGPGLRRWLPAVGDRRPVPGRPGRPAAAPLGHGRLRRRSGPSWSRPWCCRACRSWPWWPCYSRPRCSRPCSIRPGRHHPRHPAGRALRPRRRGDCRRPSGRPGGRRGRRGSGGGLHRRAALARHRCRHVRALRLARRHSAPAPGRRGEAGIRPAVPAGAHAGRIPAGVRRPGAADPAAVRLARGLLHDPRGSRRPVCEQARRRADRDRLGAGVHGARHHGFHAAVHPVRPRRASGPP